MTYAIQPIALVESPYKQKFAIPRQANLVPEARGRLVFQAAYSDPNNLRGIEQFSHLWLLFLFHATADQGWSATVQPPRLGGKERVGVFASRSPFRPNAIGMSVVENRGHELERGSLVLHVAGLDLLDGTPVIDIKPYLPYADSIADARAGFAEQAPATALTIDFTPEAERQLLALQADLPDLEQFIRAVLAQDPRPAWRAGKEDDKQYGMALYDRNIKWRVDGERILVLSILPVAASRHESGENTGTAAI